MDLNRFVPHAEHRIDVRGHMQRMRRARRDLSVQICRRNAQRGKRRIVVTVDDVVREARVVGLLRRFLGEDRGGLALLRQLLVVEIDRLVQGERVEDPRFGIIRVLFGHALHRLFVQSDARLVIDGVVILVVGLHRLQIRGLARRFRRGSLALLDGIPGRLHVRRREWRDQRIGPLTDREAPIGHRATGILRDDRLEGLTVSG